MIFFCTTCKGRTQHLERTLPLNLHGNPTARFIVLDYNSPDNLLEYLASHHGAAIESGQLTVYTYRGNHAFRMAHAKNMAHRCALLEGATVLCNLDADNFTGVGLAEFIEREIDADSFLWARMIPGQLSRGISGRIAVTANQFLCAGGYDEKYSTWGPDDKDFNTRLQRMGWIPKEIDVRFLDAVRHNDKMRFREYKDARTSSSDCHAFDVDRSATVVNFGALGCGTVYRNFDWDKPIELKPLPTRIFGIGLHKTGTTSLHEALKILGFTSWHWNNAHDARRIWNEMTDTGKSPTLERFYALSDLPIPLLYKELDRAYPGSKFILTMRRESNWLRSVDHHWDASRNRFRHAWDNDPFTHKAHRLLYGRKTFDAAVMLERYQRHNQQVTEYFYPRRELYVLDLDRNAGWPELCAFLDKPVPSNPYPMAYATKYALPELRSNQTTARADSPGRDEETASLPRRKGEPDAMEPAKPRDPLTLLLVGAGITLIWLLYAILKGK